jgi:predicted transcriptional regulator
MRIAKTISITLPPELLLKAQEIAQREHRTMSELFREALRTYVATNKRTDQRAWDEWLERTRAHGRSLGIKSEEDVDRILGEYRTEGLG